MKELSVFQNFIFRLGALLILSGLVVRLFSPLVGLYSFGVGVLFFSLMQLRAEYLGRNIVLVRLRRQQMLGCFFLVLSLLAMSMQTLDYGILYRNEWVVALAIGAFLELYTAWRIPMEIRKENNLNKS